MLGHILSEYPAYIRFFFAGELWVGIFFFYSGYGLRISQLSKKGYLNGFIIRKFVQIYIPFLIAETIYTSCSATFGYIRIDSVLDFLLRCSGIKLSNSILWYVIELLVIYLLFYIWFGWSEKKQLRNLESCCFVACAYIGFLVCSVVADLGTWWYISTFTFIVGLWCADRRDISVCFPKSMITVLKVAGSLSFFAIYILIKGIGYFDLNFGSLPTTYVITALQMIDVPLFVLLLGVISSFKNVQKFLKSRLMQFLGGISYEIYLWHMFSALVINKFMGERLAISTIATIMISIVLAYLANIFNRRIKNIIFNRAIYGRTDKP